MKNLLVSLLFAASSVSAGEYWTTPTEQGGEIVLEFTKTDGCGSELWWMYVVKSNQEVVYGCWTIIDNRIHVRYDNGVRRAYDVSGWTKKGTP